MTASTVQATPAKAMVEQLIAQLWGEGQVSDPALLAADCAVHAPNASDLRGRESVERFAQHYRKGFPDLKPVMKIQLQQGDKVASEFSLVGTHSGRFEGVPPSGRALELTVLAFSRLEGDTVVEQWYQWDRRAVADQIGVMPAL
jgi:predicted ester cyclase